jgi:hypothetical protein
MVAGELLDDALGGVLEHHEAAHQLEEPALVEDAVEQREQLEGAGRDHLLAVDRAPRREPLEARADRADPGLAVGDDQERVVGEQRRDLLLVGLELLVGVGQRRVLIPRVLELDHHQRQAVHHDDHVGAPVVVALDDRELVDRHPVVLLGVVVVDQAQPQRGHLAGAARDLDLDAVAQHAMERAVVLQHGGRLGGQDPAQGLGAGAVGRLGVEPVERLLEASTQDHVAEAGALRGRLLGRDVRAVDALVAELREVQEGQILEIGLGDLARAGASGAHRGPGL